MEQYDKSKCGQLVVLAKETVGIMWEKDVKILFLENTMYVWKAYRLRNFYSYVKVNDE